MSFFEDILRAREILRNVSYVAPVKTNVELDTLTSATVFLKCETAQRTGSFKFRGAYYAASRGEAKGLGRTVATIFIRKSRTRPCSSSLVTQPFCIRDCPEAVCPDKAASHRSAWRSRDRGRRSCGQQNKLFVKHLRMRTPGISMHSMTLS
ncbi:MAG: pyridoxal-phosphate dependent enzyme [Nitrospira sp.]|nr:MAG: pyridoxal-phosphate dependent enzyme [Nitrospira sp.]